MAYVVCALWRAKEGSEERVDEAGYQAHMDSEHFTRLVKNEAIPDLLESRERSFYVTLD
jgi:quinol monooxygenase YgiN